MVAQFGSRTASVSMKEYENKSLSQPEEELEIWDESQLSRGKQCDSGRWIAQRLEHQNSNPRVLGSNLQYDCTFSPCDIPIRCFYGELEKLSENYNQILLLSRSSGSLSCMYSHTMVMG